MALIDELPSASIVEFSVPKQVPCPSDILIIIALIWVPGSAALEQNKLNKAQNWLKKFFIRQNS